MWVRLGGHNSGPQLPLWALGAASLVLVAFGALMGRSLQAPPPPLRFGNAAADRCQQPAGGGSDSSGTAAFQQGFSRKNALIRSTIGSQEGSRAAATGLTLEDFVVALPTTDRRAPLAKATRIWRQGGMRAYIAFNATPSEELAAEGRQFNETWAYYPDDNPLRSRWAGDTRGGLVPFLAHKHFGESYKWMFYMDDDTLYFPEAALARLQGFDPELPYFITDHFWAAGRHPGKEAPRCLPCHYDDSRLNRTGLPFPAPKGCPCTPQLLSKAAQNSDLGPVRGLGFSMHGGAGAWISVGLLRRVSLEDMERCMFAINSTGSDAFITICLWEAGYAMTDPGPSIVDPSRQLFDPPEGRDAIFKYLADWVSTQSCDDTCKRVLGDMVSLHVWARDFGPPERGGAYIRSIYSLMKEVRATYLRPG